MRYQGRITDWRDDKGFGFVTPHGGGPRVFVHIKSFSNRNRRPVGNELVSYELAADTRGRKQGVNIAFAGHRPSFRPSAATQSPRGVALIFAFVFLAFLAGAVALGKLSYWVPAAYLLASGVAYLAYLLDKAAARKGKWRTPETTLHLFSLAGGWPGALLAQKTLRHKTRKRAFQLMFWVTVLLNCAGLAWFFSSLGVHTLQTAMGVA